MRHTSFLVLSIYILHKNWWLQRDSNSSHQSRRFARRPQDHRHGSNILYFYAYLFTRTRWIYTTMKWINEITTHLPIFLCVHNLPRYLGTDVQLVRVSNPGTNLQIEDLTLESSGREIQFRHVRILSETNAATPPIPRNDSRLILLKLFRLRCSYFVYYYFYKLLLNNLTI